MKRESSHAVIHRSHQWIRLCGDDRLLALNPVQLHNRYVCSVHFEDRHYNSSRRVSLRHDAVPTKGEYLYCDMTVRNSLSNTSTTSRTSLRTLSFQIFQHSPRPPTWKAQVSRPRPFRVPPQLTARTTLRTWTILAAAANRRMEVRVFFYYVPK